MTATITHWRCAECGQSGLVKTEDGREVENDPTKRRMVFEAVLAATAPQLEKALRWPEKPRDVRIEGEK